MDADWGGVNNSDVRKARMSRSPSFVIVRLHTRGGEASRLVPLVITAPRHPKTPLNQAPKKATLQTRLCHVRKCNLQRRSLLLAAPPLSCIPATTHTVPDLLHTFSREPSLLVPCSCWLVICRLEGKRIQRGILMRGTPVDGQGLMESKLLKRALQGRYLCTPAS